MEESGGIVRSSEQTKEKLKCSEQGSDPNRVGLGFFWAGGVASFTPSAFRLRKAEKAQESFVGL